MSMLNTTRSPGGVRPQHDRVAPRGPAGLAFALRQFRRAPVFAGGGGALPRLRDRRQCHGLFLDSEHPAAPPAGVRDAARVVTVRPELSNGFGISLDEYPNGVTRPGRSAASPPPRWPLCHRDLRLLLREEASRSTASMSRPTISMCWGWSWSGSGGSSPRRPAEGALRGGLAQPRRLAPPFRSGPESRGAACESTGRRCGSSALRTASAAPSRWRDSTSGSLSSSALPDSRPTPPPGSDGTSGGSTESAPGAWRSGRTRPPGALDDRPWPGGPVSREPRAGRQGYPPGHRHGPATRAQLLALAAVTLLVVLLICSNVANLLLTRASARSGSWRSVCHWRRPARADGAADG